jgi:hypothetical protein
LRYIRTGSSILGRWLLDLLGIELGRRIGRQLGDRVGSAVLGHDDDPDVGAVLGRLRAKIEVLVIIVVVIGAGHGDARLGARWTKAGELGLFDIGLGTARPRQDRIDELLV